MFCAVREGVKRGMIFQEVHSHSLKVTQHTRENSPSPFVSKCFAFVACGCSL